MTTYPSSWKLSPSTKVSSVANAEGRVGAPLGPPPAPAETERMRERKREEANRAGLSVSILKAGVGAEVTNVHL